tara:strand:- start:1883 stop:2533 length:651 start_codon:yes stop_codon:yes gene_type:complete
LIQVSIPSSKLQFKQGENKLYGLGIVKGLLVTLKNFVRKPATINYPEQRAPQHSRFRGEEFAWYEERCTGCASCAKFCPLGIIHIETSPSEANIPEGDSYKLEAFDIDIARCMFCGFCVEVCPYDALFMGSGFEEAQYSRQDLVLDKIKDQREGKNKSPSTWFRPQLEAQKYIPLSGTEMKWDDAGREEWTYHPTKRPKRDLLSWRNKNFKNKGEN